MEKIRANVLFVDAGLDFPTLSGIARKRLSDRWETRLALRLAERLNPSFQELRRFLKGKDKSVRLRGQLDLQNYNWSTILSLEDFVNHERLLIDEAVNPLNFRIGSFLEAVTDEQCRLRMVSSIDHVTLSQPATMEQRVPILWQATRQGNRWRLRPNVGASRDVRTDASKFAKRWRRDGGSLCFTTRTRDLVEMVESGEVTATFPGLRYTLGQYSPKVSAQAAKAKIPMYVLGAVPSHNWNGERLKDVLREYGASTTGVKKVLMEKVAKLAESEFKLHKPMLDSFFCENRFVRVSREVKYGEQMPILGRENTLKGLLLHLYALHHLRGNVVIDPTYANDSCSIQDHALALITGRITLPGGYLQVA